MTQALDGTAHSEIEKHSMWRVKSDHPFTRDVSQLYGETVLIRRINDQGEVRFYSRGGQGLECGEGVTVGDFLMWFQFCHQEGDQCDICHRDPLRYPHAKQ